MKTVNVFLAIAAVAAAFSISSCKNSSSGNTSQDNSSKTDIASKTIDVEHFANLYCKTVNSKTAKVFLGKETDSLFTVKKDIQNNYAKIYASTPYENSLEFYMWTDKNGEKILGVFIIETSKTGQSKSLQFFTDDSKLNMAVPCKRLNEIIMNKMMSVRRGMSTFLFKMPTSPDNENITLQYRDRKDNCSEYVFVWDGHTFSDGLNSPKENIPAYLKKPAKR